MCVVCVVLLFLFKQKTAYEMRISDWSSDVCSSDLEMRLGRLDSDDFARAFARVAVDRGAGVRCAARVRIAFEPAQPHFEQRDQRGHAAPVERRPEARRGGKECVRTCRSRWSPYH